jgi:O-antigen biosynthesis protein
MAPVTSKPKPTPSKLPASRTAAAGKGAMPKPRTTKPPRAQLSMVPDHGEAQSLPVSFQVGDEELAAFKIDSATLLGRKRLQLEGWGTGDLAFSLELDGTPVSFDMTRSSRPDVVKARGVAEEDGGHGWMLVTAPHVGAQSGRWAIRLTLNHAIHQSTHSFLIDVDRSASATSAADRLQPLGFLEAASASVVSGDAVVVGWAIASPSQALFLEQEGTLFPLDDAAVRFARQDVIDAHQALHGDMTINAGFMARVDDLLPGRPVRLVVQRNDKFITLGTVQVTALPSGLQAAARWLFGLYTPRHLLAQRMARIDVPFLQPMIAQQRSNQQHQPVEVQQLGQAIAHPKASIVIPLYGRMDFVEHQLIEFARDPWISTHAEIVYVVDDHKLVEPFAQQAHTWHRLYRLPFKWVWGSTNRGFSGANNLGAAQSLAPVLAFLNSDAFPQERGWLPVLIQELHNNPSLGAVAPRLVFGDGSIQHAGIEFVRRDEWGIWINHHPRMGLEPALDVHTHTTVVPAITGACLVIERETLDAVGGWDTGYLIGDFEDSDLCLKLRANGLRVGYVPSVQLTHLERQSFKLLGQDDFRQKVVIYNAVRHQTRWAQALQELGQAA